MKKYRIGVDHLGQKYWTADTEHYRIYDGKGSGLVASAVGRYIIQYKTTRHGYYCAKMDGLWVAFPTLKEAKRFFESGWMLYVDG